MKIEFWRKGGKCFSKENFSAVNQSGGKKFGNESKYDVVMKMKLKFTPFEKVHEQF